MDGRHRHGRSSICQLGWALVVIAACSEPRSRALPPAPVIDAAGVEIQVTVPRPGEGGAGSGGSGGAGGAGGAGGGGGGSSPDMAPGLPEPTPSFTLIVQLEGESGGTVASDDGVIRCPGTCLGRYAPGTKVVLRAQTTGPALLFRGWKDGCTGTGSCEVVLTRDEHRAATFLPRGGIEWEENSFADIRAIALGEGAVFVAGRYSGRETLGGMPVPQAREEDVYLAGLDRTGKPKFVRAFGGVASEEFLSLARNSNGVLVGGLSLRKAISFGSITLDPPVDFTSALVGFSEGGDPLWGTLLPQDGGPWVVASPSRDLYTGDLGAVLRLGPTGQPIGSPLFVPVFRRGLAVDAAGNIAVAGQLSGSSTFGGRTLTATVGYDAYAAKLRPDGSALWAVLFPSKGDDDSAWDVAMDDAGDVYVVVHFEVDAEVGAQRFTAVGGEDGFVARLAAATGQVVWAKSFGGPGADLPYGLAVLDGRVFVGGLRGIGFDLGAGPLPGGGNGFAAEFTRETGALVWATAVASSVEVFALAAPTLFAAGGSTVQALIP